MTGLTRGRELETDALQALFAVNSLKLAGLLAAAIPGAPLALAARS